VLPATFPGQLHVIPVVLLEFLRSCGWAGCGSLVNQQVLSAMSDIFISWIANDDRGEIRNSNWPYDFMQFEWRGRR
jgi:hypothetical protein